MHPLIYVPRPRLWVPSDLGDTPPRGRGNCDGTIAGAGAGAGFGGARWDPSMLPGLLCMIDPGQAGTLTYNTQPTIPGTGWSGTSWAGTGLGPYTHTAGSTADLTQNVLTTGNRNLVAFAVSGLTSGTVQHKQGTTAGAVRNANGSYTDELTAQAASCLWTPSNDFDGAVTVSSISNLSLSAIAKSAGSVAGGFAQASAGSMPWRSSTLVGGQTMVESAGDWAAHSAAAATWNPLHNGSAFYAWGVVRPTSLAANCGIASTKGASSAAAVGIYVYADTTGALNAVIGNGAAVAVGGASAAGKLAVGTAALWVVRYAGSGNLEGFIAGEKVIDAAPTAAFSASDCIGLGLGSMRGDAASAAANALMGSVGFGAGTLTDSLLSRLGSWARGKYGVAW